MPLRVRTWLAALLLPCLVMLGTVETARALISCSVLGETQGSCCCKHPPSDAPCSPELKRGSCCSEQSVEAAPGQSGMLPEVGASIAVPLVVHVGFAASTPLSPARYAQAFIPHEAPRALGPPLILLHRVLRL